MSNLNKNQTNKILFSFLENIYQFQQMEFELFKLTWQQIYLLQLLKKKEIKTTTEIAERLKIELYQASRIISSLEDLNYISKIQTKKDKRSFNISITQPGIKILKDIENYNYEIISKNSSKLNSEELKSLISALTNLKQLLF